MGIGPATGGLTLYTFSVVHPRIYWLRAHGIRHAYLLCYHSWHFPTLSFVTDSTFGYLVLDLVPRMVDKVLIL